MTGRDNPFQPTSVDEHVQQLARAASRSHEPMEPSARLAQDLRIVTLDHRQTGERVWNRLVERLAGETTTPDTPGLRPNEIRSVERFPSMQVEQFPTQALPTIRSGKPPRKPRRVFTLVAALLVVALLVGGAITAVRMMPQGRNTSVAGKSTPTVPAQASAPTKPASAFPAQDCPVVTGADLSSTWYQLCKAGKFVEINQSRPLSKGYTLTIQAAYADRSHLFLLSDISPIDMSHEALINVFIKTQGGTNLPGLDGTAFRGKDQHYVSVWRYDTSHLPASMQTLTLWVRVSATIVTVHSSTPLPPVDLATISVPLVK